MLERGPYEFKDFTPFESEPPRLQTNDNFTGDDLKHYEAKIEKMNLILISISNDIYNSVDACTTAQAMWERVERLMRGTVQNKIDREIRFSNEFDLFVDEPREALVSVYDKDSYDDLFAYFFQYEKLVNTFRAKMEKSHDPLVLVVIASVIPILSDSYEESVDSHVPRVILFGTIPTSIPVILVVPAEVLIAPADPIVAPKRPERHESLTPSFKFPLATVVAPLGIRSSSDSLSNSSSIHSLGWDASGQSHSGSSTRVASPRFVDPPVRTPDVVRLLCVREMQIPCYLVPSSTHLSRLIAPALADLLHRKRFRDSYSSEAREEEHMEIDIADGNLIDGKSISSEMRPYDSTMLSTRAEKFNISIKSKTDSTRNMRILNKSKTSRIVLFWFMYFSRLGSKLQGLLVFVLWLQGTLRDLLLLLVPIQSKVIHGSYSDEYYKLREWTEWWKAMKGAIGVTSYGYNLEAKLVMQGNMEGVVDIFEFFRKLKFICHWANLVKDFKWSNVPGVKLFLFSKSDDSFSSLQALSNLYYLFSGFMDYFWSCKLNISNFSPANYNNQ
nr:hypothetical protein [Tanacetum cinerariifolium]